MSDWQKQAEEAAEKYADDETCKEARGHDDHTALEHAHLAGQQHERDRGSRCECCHGDGVIQYEPNAPAFACGNCVKGCDLNRKGIPFRDEKRDRAAAAGVPEEEEEWEEARKKWTNTFPLSWMYEAAYANKGWGAAIERIAKPLKAKLAAAEAELMRQRGRRRIADEASFEWMGIAERNYQRVEQAERERDVARAELKAAQAGTNKIATVLQNDINRLRAALEEARDLLGAVHFGSVKDDGARKRVVGAHAACEEALRPVASDAGRDGSGLTKEQATQHRVAIAWFFERGGGKVRWCERHGWVDVLHACEGGPHAGVGSGGEKGEPWECPDCGRLSGEHDNECRSGGGGDVR